MPPTAAVEQDEDARRAEFEQVMSYATEQAWAEGLEQSVMEALFDVLNGQMPEDDETDEDGVEAEPAGDAQNG